jgi:hypothetical protein
MRILSIAAAGLLVVAAASCTKQLDTAGLEDQLRTDLQEKLGRAVASVDCPPDVDAKAGVTFRCTATGEDGSTTIVEVSQDDDQGHVSWTVVDAA